MIYKSMEETVDDLEKHGHLVRIKEEVDPELEMAAVHLRVHEAGGPALLFENVKGSKFPAVSNLFGTMERSRFMFRSTLKNVQKVMEVRNDPAAAMKKPWRHFTSGLAATNALPLKRKALEPAGEQEIRISDLPLIKHWPADGGAFVTLPQVYTEDPDKPGIMNANLGMYRVQLSGNDYIMDEEVGLHYQIQRGIGVHQSKAVKKGEPLKVSIFIGGPPSHTLSAVMPLPEGLSEMTFAGMLAGRRFRYSYDKEGYAVSNDADFVITGEIYPDETKPEGPFGDHLGYYSLTHEFPVMRVNKVYARTNAIWPFTVVGRPPQEDTTFGTMIHELTGDAVRQEIPGVKEVHAVDASGVHPLLFAIGSERYTPYDKPKRPAELLTLANRILGFGQLSLAKYLFITGGKEDLSTHEEQSFLTYILERIDLQRDLHFQTNTTIDTLDYSGTGLNEGSKVIIAAYGEKKRQLSESIPSTLRDAPGVKDASLIMPGIAAVELPVYASAEKTEKEMKQLSDFLHGQEGMGQIPLLVVCDDAQFTGESLSNFLWAAFTRSNPSHDIFGVGETYSYKHWGCDQMIIDARKKPHHAPPLLKNDAVEKNIERLFTGSGSLAHLGLQRM
ncbi:UbiD family decarboxylase [Alkalicoccus saliphilus]|uniref:3-octaprenyl-4-hydroxybenzoate carboxy-lyase n=1 Tax=Alkalicoccus saliphilus TaxID=200989 RepID=A0A2T4U2U4_9BACI|nr:UbiD family decarboxylase [Alkalicoccus saliphilus]PTL37714.1 3-octaprenyl-4-hydroxybenzoate carboxy-lyase [Alkalicoccus saliphilus]